MGKVQLKITPSFASILDAQSSDWLIVEKEIGEGATIGDLLTDLAPGYDNFHDMVFNPNTGEISDRVMIILNDSLLQFPDVTKAKLKNGDSVMLAVVFPGG